MEKKGSQILQLHVRNYSRRNVIMLPLFLLTDAMVTSIYNFSKMSIFAPYHSFSISSLNFSITAKTV
jgi:hypothetical protein